MSECPYVKDTGSCPVPGCPVCQSANNVSEKARDKAERAKIEGNDAYKNQDYKTALRHYSLAVNLVPTSHVYRSNRSAAYSGLGQYKEALEDAQKTIELNREWAKGYARAGLAFKGLRYYHLAADAYQKACDLGEATDANLQSVTASLQAAASSGFSKEDETRTLTEQADAEKQAAMAEMGCSVM
eukprot:Rhum_TRINITY_DN15535_c0_g1::Rhum_TRINITY_DN15535_c0_g1_i1::g.161141::m.161141